MHSGLRWVALVLLVLTVVRSVSGWRGNTPFSEGQRKLGLFTMITLHIQLLVGLMVYMTRGWIGMLKAEGTMSNSYTRFFAVEHGSLMVLAIVLGTLGYSLSKRAADDATKHRKQAMYFGLALVLILAAIPWPFRQGFEQVGWF